MNSSHSNVYPAREGDLDTGAQPARTRILFLLSSLIVGGSEKKTVRIANALYRNGHEVRIAYINGRERAKSPLLDLIDRGVPVHCLERRGRYSLPALMRLRRLLAEFRPTNVVCVNHHTLLYAVPAALANTYERPNLIALLNKTVFASRAEERYMRVYRFLLSKTHRMVFGCRYQMETWLYKYKLDRSKATYIYNGVDVETFAEAGSARILKESRPDGAHILIGTVGQLRAGKNQEELLRGLRLLAGKGMFPRLMLVGDGPERSRLEQVVNSLGLTEQVQFQGQVGDVREHLEQMHVFAITSFVETFSNAALEAMSMGCPLVMSRMSGAEEMIEHGVNGFLYELGDTETLATLLEQLCRDKQLRCRIGANARRTVKQRFSFDRMVAEYERLLVPPTPPAELASGGRSEV